MPQELFDIHTHILPGLDDGPRTRAESLEMACVAADDGTRLLVATPHRKDVTEGSSIDQVRRLIDEMDSLFKGEGIELTLLLGMENHLDLDLPDEVQAGRALTMNGSRYILVEMPFFGRPIYTEEVLFRLQVMGLTPILAHPERIEAFQNDVDLLAGLVEKGMISQITGGSIIGEFGGRTQRLSHTLLRRGLAHIIGSDTHFPKGNRSPKLAGCVEAAEEIIGHEQAWAMAIDIPKAIIDDQPIELEPPKAANKPRRWWRFGSG